MKTRSGVTTKIGAKEVPFRLSKRSTVTPLEDPFHVFYSTPRGVFSWFHRVTQNIFGGLINLTKKRLFLSFEMEYIRQKILISQTHGLK